VVEGRSDPKRALFEFLSAAVAPPPWLARAGGRQAGAFGSLRAPKKWPRAPGRPAGAIGPARAHSGALAYSGGRTRPDSGLGIRETEPRRIPGKKPSCDGETEANKPTRLRERGRVQKSGAESMRRTVRRAPLPGSDPPIPALALSYLHTSLLPTSRWRERRWRHSGYFRATDFVTSWPGRGKLLSRSAVPAVGAAPAGIRGAPTQDRRSRPSRPGRVWERERSLCERDSRGLVRLTTARRARGRAGKFEVRGRGASASTASTREDSPPQ